MVSVAPVETTQLSSGNKLQGKPLSITTQHAIDEIERYMSMDRLVSSYHNVITQAGLEVCYLQFGFELITNLLIYYFDKGES